MPMELRKRKSPAEPAPPPPAKKKLSKKAADKANEAEATNGVGSPTRGPPTVGSTISLEDFGGIVKTHEGDETTLAKLAAESKNGVVLFTYPKASTPGCTKQACMFRDEYKPLTSTGFAIYGLSRDLPMANYNFVTKQSLPYPLLCDPAATLITAIGMKKLPSGTIRGVFVVDKSGKVLAAEPGSPDATVNVVRRLVGDSGNAAPMDGVKHTASTMAAKAEPVHNATTEAKKSETQLPTGSKIEKVPLTPTPAEDAAKAATSTGPSVPGNALENPAKDAAVAKVAADVADSAQKVDPAVPKPNSTSLNVPHGTLADRAKDVAMARVADEVADSAQGVDPATPNPA